MGTGLWSDNIDQTEHPMVLRQSHWHLQCRSEVRFESTCTVINIPWALVAGWASHLLPMFLTVVAHTSHLRIVVVISR